MSEYILYKTMCGYDGNGKILRQKYQIQNTDVITQQYLR